MANLKFARGTTTPTYSTSGFDDGCIYFNTSNQNIYLRNGTSSSSSTVEVFKGTDTNNIPTYTSAGVASSVSKAFVSIQSLPGYGATATAGASSTTWYNWIGQGVASASAIAQYAYDDGDFDSAVQDYKSLPPIQSAKEIVVAVSPFYLAYAANGGTSGTGMSFLSSDSVVVRCYRTIEPNYPVEDPSSAYYPEGGSLFRGTYIGYSGYGASTSSGKSLQLYTMTIELCYLCGNGVYVSLGGWEINGGGNTNTGGTFSGVSGGYGEIGTPRPNIEKYIYPLFIRY